MKYAVLVGKGLMNGSSNGWKNIGDYVQSLAQAQYLPQVDEWFDRENPCPTGDEIKMIMNAWYMWNPDRFPAFKRIIPLPVSMHISPMIQERLFKNSHFLSWFKEHEPIGCRDKNTEEFLKSKGIKSYFSACLTLTLGRKYKFKGERKGFIFVDPYIAAARKELNIFEFFSCALFGVLHLSKLSKIQKNIKHHYCTGRFLSLKKIIYAAIFAKTYSKYFSLSELSNAEFVSHMVKVGDGTNLQTEEEKMAYAESLVKKYAQANLVVTGRIHCALPCLGLETPVLFTVGQGLEEKSAISSAGRFGGLIDFFNVVRIRKLKLTGDFEFPVRNKDLYKPYAENLQRQCEEFIKAENILGGYNCIVKIKRRRFCMPHKQIKPQKILLVGLYEDANLGDKVIFDCTSQLLNEYGNIEIMPLYLAPNLNVVERGMNKLYKMVCVKEKSYNLLSHFYYRRFSSAVRSSDKVVFAGGGLIKYKSQFFGSQISAICKLASKYSKRVYFNTTGVEGYEEGDIRCKILKQSINQDCVRYISTRDDIDCLNRNYITNPSIKTFFAADSAVFSASVYGITKQDSDVIGIGLIRKNIFRDNAVDFSGNELCDFYIRFIKQLQKEGVKFQFFTNGLPMDLELADAICGQCNFDKNEIIIPKSAKELVQVISGFKCVISGRLHACIISYSLGIPAIGLCWNDKLKLFGRNTGFSERFIEPKNLNADYVLFQLKKTMEQGYNEAEQEKFMQTQLQSIQEIIND